MRVCRSQQRTERFAPLHLLQARAPDPRNHGEGDERRALSRRYIEMPPLFDRSRAQLLTPAELQCRLQSSDCAASKFDTNRCSTQKKVTKTKGSKSKYSFHINQFLCRKSMRIRFGESGKADVRRHCSVFSCFLLRVESSHNRYRKLALFSPSSQVTG